MSMIERRHRFQIYFQILWEIHLESQRTGLVKPTHISYSVSVPYNRLKEYLKELVNMGMIVDHGTYKITEKGERFLVEYERLTNFLADMGMLKVNNLLKVST